MATAKKASTPMHPPFTRMVCDSMHAMDQGMAKGEHHGHSLLALKKYMGEHYKMGAGWEKRLNATVKMMLKKKQLAHMQGHMGTFRLSKGMAVKEEKRLHRAAHMKTAQAMPKKTKVAKKKAAPKKTGPAKRAKKAAPKK